jgi:hypothetical protein
MADINEYDEEQVQRCLSVLIELMTILEEYQEYFVVVGGWVPRLLCSGAPEARVGTTDVDVAINFEEFPDAINDTVGQILEKNGYEQALDPDGRVIPSRFLRKLEDGQEIAIDFLAGEYHGTGKSHRHQRTQDINPRKARGGDIVFSDYVEIALQGKMPNGDESEIKLKVSGMAAFLVMKGMALWDRDDAKDPYDIVYSIKNYPKGADALVEEIQRHSENKLVLEGLGKIKTGFNDINGYGPVAYADFLLINDEEDRTLGQRDAYETINAFLDALEIEPYSEGR